MRTRVAGAAAMGAVIIVTLLSLISIRVIGFRYRSAMPAISARKAAISAALAPDSRMPIATFNTLFMWNIPDAMLRKDVTGHTPRLGTPPAAATP